MKKLIKILLLITIISLTFQSYCQEIIYIDDSINVAIDSSSYTEIKTLPRKLKDGKYILVNIKSKDSNRINLNKNKLVEGEYKDSLRQGVFNYYSPNYLIFNSKIFVKKVETYDKGLLNGYFGIFNESGEIAYEGYYKNNKKHGFFIRYKSDKIVSIKLFEEGVLKYFSKAPNITVMHQPRSSGYENK